MKKLTSLVSVLFLCHLNGITQICFGEGLALTSQVQIDLFQESYPECNHIGGDLVISGMDIYDLSGLMNVKSVEGDLIIGNWEYGGNPNLSTLSGLDNLSHIGGSLTIIFNSGLYDLSGLNGLFYLKDCLLVGWNSIVSLSGLEGLNHVGGDLEIHNNPNLTNLDGIMNITSVNGSMIIDNNCALTSLSPLIQLTFILNDLYIGNNPLIEDLAGLNNLTTIGGNLSVYLNLNLLSLYGLEGLTSLQSIYLQRNTALKTLEGLDNLQTITGNLWIGGNNQQSGNPELTNLLGLGHLNAISGSLIICYNKTLNDLNGIEKLKTIGSELVIRNNQNLKNLAGLDSLYAVSVERIEITGNHSLSQCDIKGMCDYLAAPGGIMVVQNNRTGCNSVDEIEQSCKSNGSDEMTYEEFYSIQPNPMTNLVEIRFNLLNSSILKIELFNCFGQIEMEEPGKLYGPGIQQVCWQVNHLKDGIYICRITNGNKMISRKVIKH